MSFYALIYLLNYFRITRLLLLSSISERIKCIITKVELIELMTALASEETKILSIIRYKPFGFPFAFSHQKDFPFFVGSFLGHF